MKTPSCRNYSRELAGIASSDDPEALNENSRKKRELMREIEGTHEALAPLLKRERSADGKLREGDCERLRLEAVDLLKQIDEAETANLEAIQKSRSRSVEAMQQVGTAKRVARGYRRGGSSHRYLDTKG